MKYSVGYKIEKNTSFTDEIIRCKSSIAEVYFSYGDFANGRSRIKLEGVADIHAQMKQETDLARLSESGIALNVLFNAMCYGKDSLSRAFFEKIGDTLQHLGESYGVRSVTTTSPIIAKFIKENFSGTEVRASVNMSVGSVEGMEYISDVFDSFYLKRELNHDFNAIKELKHYCDENGKRLYALANSGCLDNCSAHVFHDSLVAHEEEIAVMDNGYVFEGVCRKFIKRTGAEGFLSHTSFIRPEDVHYYEEIFPFLKLATRVSAHPLRTLRAYIKESFSGNAACLLEPDHSGMMYPRIVENSALESCIENGKLIYKNTKDAIITLE